LRYPANVLTKTFGAKKMNYEYDPRTEAVARAIAKTQGWDFTDDAYCVLQQPARRAMDFWVMAVAAIKAADFHDWDATEEDIAAKEQTERMTLACAIARTEAGVFDEN
jgi:hypothetical protein